MDRPPAQMEREINFLALFSGLLDWVGPGSDLVPGSSRIRIGHFIPGIGLVPNES